MSGATTAKRYIREAARRARGERPVPLDKPLVTATGRLGDYIRRAADHAHMGTEIDPEARLKPVREAMMRAARIFTGYQIPFNLAVVDALADIDEMLEELPSADRATVAMSSLEVYAQDLNDRVEALEQENADLRVEMAKLRAELADGSDTDAS